MRSEKLRDPEIDVTRLAEKEAFRVWKDERSETAWVLFRDCRRRRKKCVARARRERREGRLREIEELKSRDPKEFWRKLKQFAGIEKGKEMVTEIRSSEKS